LRNITYSSPEIFFREVRKSEMKSSLRNYVVLPRRAAWFKAGDGYILGEAKWNIKLVHKFLNQEAN
jgi:hypothetical protein